MTARTGPSKTALYRHFDSVGRLLYVGITNHVLRRLDQHAERAHWFGEISKIKVEWFETRSDALVAEACAITTEHPIHNISRPDAPAVWWAIQHAKSRRLDGWYMVRQDAEEVRDYLAREYLGEVFETIPSSRFDEPPKITDRNWLTITNDEEWAPFHLQCRNQAAVSSVT